MPELTEWQLREVQPGMYHYPSELNRGAKRYCSGCEHGQVVGKPVVRGFEQRVRCKMLVASRRKRLSWRAPEIIEPGAVGCKYWEARR